jgi:phospholipid/cholesterol/gamma-HCH transport system substrate-binding protein
LHPAAVQLTSALRRLVVVAPELRTLVQDVAPLNRAARTGFPALQRFLVDSVPFLQRLKPYLGQLVPVIDYIDLYRREIAAFFANSTATTEGTLPSAYGHNEHYLRAANAVSPEVLTPYQTRLQTNRSNPYMAPGGFDRLRKGLAVFGSYLCTSHPLPTPSPSLSTSTTSVSGTVLTIAQLLEQYYFTSNPSGPPCVSQSPPAKSTTGQSQSFPHLQPLP